MQTLVRLIISEGSLWSGLTPCILEFVRTVRNVTVMQVFSHKKYSVSAGDVTTSTKALPYFLRLYKMEVFPFQTNPENLDLSYKPHIIAKFHRTDLVICSYSGEGKTQSYSGMNMVHQRGMDTYHNKVSYGRSRNNPGTTWVLHCL